MAYREVHLIDLQIDDARGRAQLQVDLGMLALEGAEPGDEPCGGERWGQRQPHRAATARGQQGLGSRMDLVHRRCDLLQIAAPGVRHFWAFP